MLIEVFPQSVWDAQTSLAGNIEWQGSFRMIGCGVSLCHPQVLNLDMPVMEPDVESLIAFLTRSQPLPILIFGADEAVSAAIGEVLNWYFNRYLHQQSADFQFFFRHCPLVKPDSEVYHLLLSKLLEVEHG